MTTSPEALREAVERLTQDLAAREAYIKGADARGVRADQCVDVRLSDLRTLLSALQEAREALVPDGWALVPIEPTEAMISAGANGTRNGARETAARTYASMLSAAEVYRALSPGGVGE